MVVPVADHVAVMTMPTTAIIVPVIVSIIVPVAASVAPVSNVAVVVVVAAIVGRGHAAVMNAGVVTGSRLRGREGQKAKRQTNN